MIWILIAAVTFPIAAALFTFAYKYAIREGLDADNKSIPKPQRVLLMAWRGLGPMAREWLSEAAYLAGAIFFLPFLLIVSPIQQSDPTLPLFFVVRVIGFSLVAAIGIYYLVEISANNFGYLVLAPVIWAGLGLAATLRETGLVVESLKPPPAAKIPLKKMLAELGGCGISLLQGVSPADLRTAAPPNILNDYDGLVMVMGGVGRDLADPPFSDDVWYHDVECINEPEDYVRVANHLRRLSKGDFAIKNVHAKTDDDGFEIALRFTLRGKKHILRGDFDGDDMIDVEIWAELQELFEESCKEGRTLAQVNFGQAGCYFYITAEQKACLQELGLVFFR